MTEKLTRELAKKLMKIKGEARGTHFICDAKFVLKEKGKEGLKKVEEKLKEVGYPIEYEKIKNMEFYPAGMRALSLLAIKEAFKWDDEKIKEMCAFAPKISFIVKLFARFFFSPVEIIKKGPEIWREYFTEGDFEIIKVDLKKKECIFRVKNFSLCKSYCKCLEGFITSLVKMVLNPKKIDCKEQKCTFEGGKYHEYLVTWE